MNEPREPFVKFTITITDKADPPNTLVTFVNTWPGFIFWLSTEWDGQEINLVQNVEIEGEDGKS